MSFGLSLSLKARERWCPRQEPVGLSRHTLPSSTFCSARPSADWATPVPLGRATCFTHSMDSSKNAFIDTPRILFTQLPGHCGPAKLPPSISPSHHLLPLLPRPTQRQGNQPEGSGALPAACLRQGKGADMGTVRQDDRCRQIKPHQTPQPGFASERKHDSEWRRPKRNGLAHMSGKSSGDPWD